MSVIVKGMRMPENCDVCCFGDWSNLHQTASCKLKGYEPCFSDYSQEYRAKRSTICPLVALPEKHGRLIDADELIEFVEDRYEITWESDCYEGGIKDACSDIIEKINTMQTVIEAEDGT